MLDLTIRRILRPLVRLMLSKGVTFPSLVELLKRTFVEAAEQDFSIQGKPQTASRISLLTGVHRKDVKRIREQPDPGEDEFHKLAPLGSRLIAAWSSLDEYTDENGEPKRLPRLASQGGGHSFEELAAKVSKDVRPRTILDELQQQGAISIGDDGLVELVVSAFIPEQDLEQKLFYFGNNLHDHTAAAVSNVIGKSAPWLERSVHYDDLSAESVVELHKLSERLGMQVLKAVNRRAMQLDQNGSGNAGDRRRVTFGVYFFGESAEMPINFPPETDKTETP